MDKGENTGASDPQREVKRKVFLLLMFVLVIGALLRGLYIMEISRYPGFAVPLVDAAYHDYWARALVSGDWTPPAGL